MRMLALTSPVSKSPLYEVTVLNSKTSVTYVCSEPMKPGHLPQTAEINDSVKQIKTTNFEKLKQLILTKFHKILKKMRD